MRDFSSQTSLPKSIRATSLRRNWERVPMAPFILLSIGLLEKSTRRYRISLHRVALKRINDVFRTKTDAKRTLREITILRQCHHPNIAALKCYHSTNFTYRDLVVPSDEYTYKNLWIIQVRFTSRFQWPGIRRMGYGEDREELR